MPLEDISKIIHSVADLLGAIAWPLVLVWVASYFGKSIKTFIEDIGGFTFKGAGMEASVSKLQLRAVAGLAANAAASDAQGHMPPGEAAQEAVTVVTEMLNTQTVKRASKTKILWVDDRPQNNRQLQQSLQALGMTIRLAESTEHAMGRLTRERFDLIISDMGRPNDPRAGYTLLEQMCNAGIKLPLIFYSAGGNLPENVRLALEKGAFGSTNQGTELFRLVFSALNASNLNP